ncbi:hypothetical protein K440DRAFT_665191 [Wilcoxina mikolae CBS 423.85]|nr:hypothetical protein K440DRAFT_665191 [Wilcoxina mikolae CBS 423.85]
MSSTRPKSFEDAIETYIARRLSSSGQRNANEIRDELQITTPTELVDRLKAIEQNFSNQSRFKKFVNRVTPFIEKLQRFTKLIDVAVQSGPKISAPIWAALKVVFELASQFSEFFEKLIRMVERISTSLPDIDIYIDQFKRQNGLHTLLVDIYVDILDFCAQVTNIFVKKDKRPRSTAYIFASIAWAPFDERFKSIIQSFEDHREYIRCRAETAWMQADGQERREAAASREALVELRADVKKAAKEKEREAMETSVWRIMLWLDPVSCLDTYEDTSSLRHPGTGQWVVQSDAFRKFVTTSKDDALTEGVEGSQGPSIAKESFGWIDGSKQDSSVVDGIISGKQLLWIKGKPGCGKTFITPILVEAIEANYQTKALSERSTISYFFCDYKNPRKSSVLEILRSLLCQILRQNKSRTSLIDVFAFAMSHSTCATASSRVELWQLLELALQSLPSAYLVIDGVDECDNCEELSRNLKRLSVQPGLVHVLALGRMSDRDLQKHFRHSPQLTITSDENFDDISSYVASRIDSICRLGFGPGFAMSKDEIINKLTTASNGMFLWARLMVDLLSSCSLYQDERSDILNGIGLAEGLEQLYARIFHILSSRPKHERNLAKKVFMWVACAKERLTVSELEIALVQGESAARRSAVASLPDFMGVIIVACGGLVEVTKDSRFQFIHLTVQEWLHQQYSNEDSSRTHAGPNDLQLRHSKSEGHITLARACLDYLLHGIPDTPLSGDDSPGLARPDKLTIGRRYPFLRYASSSWLWHLGADLINSNSPSAEKCLALLRKFVSQRSTVLTWLESTYLHKDPPEWNSFERLLKWAGNISYRTCNGDKGLIQSLNLFVTDVQTMRSRYDKVLLSDPQEIWSGLTDLLPKGGLLNHRLENFTQCHPEAPPSLNSLEEETWAAHRPVVTYSELSSNGSVLGVCSVWASRKFRQDFTLRPPILGLSFEKQRALDGDWDLDDASKGWIMRVEKWDIDTQNSRSLKSKTTDITLDPQAIRAQLEATLIRDNFGRPCFGFPIKFSPNLRKVAVLNMVFDINIVECAPASSIGEYSPKTLSFAGASKGFLHDYRITFSNDNRYVGYHISRRPRLLYSGSQRMVGVYDVECSLPGDRIEAIWEKCVPSITGFINMETSRQPGSDEGEYQGQALEVAFHPTKPLIAWSGSVMGTFVTNFVTEYSILGEQICREELGDLRFSACGSVLYGVDVWRSRELLQFPLNRPFPTNASTGVAETLRISEDCHSPQSNCVEEDVNRRKDDVGLIMPGSLAISRTASQYSEVYSLHCSGSAGRGISIQRTRADGSIEGRTVAHIPSWSRFTPSDVRLAFDEKRQNFGVIFNEAARSYYPACASPEFEGVDTMVPAVYHRNNADLPAWSPVVQTASRRKRLPNGEAPEMLEGRQSSKRIMLCPSG